MQKLKAYMVLLVAAIVLMPGALLFIRLYTYPLAGIAHKASQKISEKSTRMDKTLQLLFADSSARKAERFYRAFEKHSIGVYLFRKDSLVFWNNAQVPVEPGARAFASTQGLARLRQGYYLYKKSVHGDSTALALCLLKPLYDLQNNYLKNYFSAWTGIPKELELDTALTATALVFNGQPVCSLKGNEESYLPEWAADTGFAAFILGFVCLLLSLVHIIKRGIGWPHFTALLVLLISARALMLWLQWPAFFYKSLLYDVHTFGDASSWDTPYLGDMLLNALLLVFVAVALHAQLRVDKGQRNNIIQVILLFVVCFIGLNRFNHSAVSLVTNSTLNFDLLSIFTIKLPAFAGIVALALYALGLYILINKICQYFTQRSGLLFLPGVLAICVVQQWFSPPAPWLQSYWLLAFALVQIVLVKRHHQRAALGIGLQILLMSVVTSLLLNAYIEKRQNQNLELLSLTLSERHDPILESEFAAIPRKMGADDKLSVLLLFLPNGKKEVDQLIRQKYFGEYFNRYTIELSLFDADCNPLLMPKNPVLLNEGFFEDQVRYNSDSTSVPGLFFVKNYKNNSQYIGKIKLGDKNLYALMEPKQFEELGSFPDLLLDQSQQKQEELKGFSYAVYRVGRNTSRYGDFNYPFFILDSAALTRSSPGFEHHYFRDSESVQVISQRTKTWPDKFTYNSYIFLFFSIISYLAYLTYSILYTTQLNSPSLTRRIQSIIIVLLLFLMSAVGITSGSLVAGQFEADNRQQLQEKTEIILGELAARFKPGDFFDDSQKELVNQALNDYAHLFNTVISLFDKHGYLYNTSQPRLYELGLAAPLASPRAYWDLKENRASSESIIENAGSLRYFSLYTPLYNSKQELVGFVNLPYFARQSDLANELSGIISALINVYVILFVISILAGLILSGYITQPLQLIKQQIANITLGRQNEKINWNSNDEIGKLVAEYNQMLVKLEESATLLAQSERESAWREMARQVAHEIKNPLTPMKLNLQYLQHLMKNNAADFNEKFEKASAGIIEQIDALAGIASAFSNFARLPAASLEQVNLAEIIKSAVLIFDNQKNVAIHNHIAQNDLLVMGDKDQCLRVCNNILKNAVQALDEVSEPRIDIYAELREQSVIISISDNGCGIADELKPKIFSPNFTTKSTGSGLGLAMVKNIMQGFGGKIWFSSQSSTGTTFYLEFNRQAPVAEQ